MLVYQDRLSVQVVSLVYVARAIHLMVPFPFGPSAFTWEKVTTKMNITYHFVPYNMEPCFVGWMLILVSPELQGKDWYDTSYA